MILDAGTHFAFAGLIREFFGAIDNIVYWLFVNIYNLFIDIANLKLFSDSTLQTFGQRIYVLLGIVMLFRISFSIVGYIVDPDKLTDSKAGFGSLIKNVVISLVLIVTVPIIFRYSRLLQEALLKDNTIPRIITGKQKNTYTEKSLGDELALDILSTFIYPNQNLFPDCNANTILGVTDEDGNFQEKTGPCYKPHDYESSDGTSYTYQFLDVKDGAVVNPEGVKHPEANMNIEYYEIYASVSKAKGNNNARRKSYSDLLALAEKTNLITSQSNINGSNQYWISYQYIISTIGIAVIAYIFLLFCIDIAVRTVKLGFLQLYAPIPIVMYIDPKSKSKFDEWVKMCVSTYLDLFVRLASIFFALEMIRLLASESALVKSGNSLLVKFFIILGCLMFAKQLPKILEQLLGIKTPDFTLNPLKKIENEALGGKAISKGLGLAGRTVGNIAGGLGHLAWANTGGKLAENMKGKYDKSGLKNVMDGIGGGINTAYNYMDDAMGGKLGRIGADVSGTLGGAFLASTNKKKSAYSNYITTEQAFEKRALEQIEKGAAGALSEKYVAYTEQINAARQAGDANRAAQLQNELNAWWGSNEPNGAASQYIDYITSGKFTDDFGNVLSGKDADAAMSYTVDKNKGDYKGFGDKSMSDGMLKKLHAAASIAGIDPDADAKTMHREMGILKGKVSEMEAEEFKRNEAKK